MTLSPADCITPDWAAPRRVRALLTTRRGGVSEGPYASLNLGLRVGDDPARVAENRRRLAGLLPAPPRWLRQVHGNRVVEADGIDAPPEADSSFTRRPGVVCAVQMADCMPVLFTDRAAQVVAVAHAGWRGLAGGVLENTVAALGVPPDAVIAWLGPAIGPAAFEVGDEVREAFVLGRAAAESAFRPHGQGKWLADLYALARQRLAAVGVTDVGGGDFCTHTDTARFFSHRRDGVSGRMAALVWLEA